ncbi:hypothetical protein [Lentibacillus sp. CBA3610]|uniref:hypothetical protein n=1 Tax=Lentibacillus sp. CBA3610 TaxID=2518176 RepID=UPI00159629D0|nr:hypothetical protein [Lentibacillus sp. CBA3610]QKY70755.1 hypothetical protein Len3610_15205 [Lentibacillus sp. CBA3610]
MSQQIGNIGVLNLVHATEESIKNVERIENAGVVVYSQENAHLLTALNIGNIGNTVEIPQGYRFHNGWLHLNKAYFQSITEPENILVNGLVVIDNDVEADHISSGYLNLMVNGKIYCPSHLAGAANQLMSEGESGDFEIYDGYPPRFENGEFKLTNSFLQSIEEPLYLVVNGVLSFSKDLNMREFMEKISILEANGVIYAYEEQEEFLYKKIDSLTTAKFKIYPIGFEVINKQLKLNARSIHRFQSKKIYTEKPIIIEADVTREQLAMAIDAIHSSAIIVCHESLEDLIYERCSLLDTEVLPYEYHFIMIDDEEVWSNDQFLALENETNFIVNGKLILDDDVTEATLKKSVAAVDVLGEIELSGRKQKSMLQPLLRLSIGSIRETENDNQSVSYLRNIGELSL